MKNTEILFIFVSCLNIEKVFEISFLTSLTIPVRELPASPFPVAMFILYYLLSEKGRTLAQVGPIIFSLLSIWDWFSHSVWAAGDMTRGDIKSSFWSLLDRFGNSIKVTGKPSQGDCMLSAEPRKYCLVKRIASLPAGNSGLWLETRWCHGKVALTSAVCVWHLKTKVRLWDRRRTQAFTGDGDDIVSSCQDVGKVASSPSGSTPGATFCTAWFQPLTFFRHLCSHWK